MDKVQLRGHCQCCGRDQAVLTDGRMAQHGYDVKNGYFRGVCSGSRYHPIEKDREAAYSVIHSCRDEAATLRQRAVDYRSGAKHPEKVTTGWWDPVTRDKEMIPWADASAYQQRHALESAAWNAEGLARQAERFADGLLVIVEAYHGKPLQEVVKPVGPEPIAAGEKRVSKRGVIACEDVFKGMVKWRDERGFYGRMSTRAWRNLEKQP